MYTGLIDIPFRIANLYPKRDSHIFRKNEGFEHKTYSQLAHDIKILALSLGTIFKKGDHVAFFINNRYEWIVTDFALMSIGAVSVPRGSDTAPKEAEFLYRHSDSTGLIVENTAQLKELVLSFNKEGTKLPDQIILVDYDEESLPIELKSSCIPYNDLLKKGEILLDSNPDLYEEYTAQITEDTLVTIIYTSGTTGNPKGVMLNHINFMQNVHANTPRLAIDPEIGEVTVSILPAWHVFERAFEYIGLGCGLTFVYSSLKFFAKDLTTFKPQILISVPRVWESIYQKLIKYIDNLPQTKRVLFYFMVKVNYAFDYSHRYLRGSYLYFRKKRLVKWAFYYLMHSLRMVFLAPLHLAANAIFKPVRARIGGRLRGAISGGGALPHYIDSFFNSVGIGLLNAYGMTECAPGILSRTFSQNTIGATGTPFLNTEIKILKEDGALAKEGEKGILYVKGAQVMTGYYKNPEATAAILSSDGWLNTGDLAMESANGDLVLVGRSKDTIVLAGGENVEPEPLEDKLKESPLIDHAVVMGQDKKGLTALIAVNSEELKKIADRLKISNEDLFTHEQGGKELAEIDEIGSLEKNPGIMELIQKEATRLISREQGFKPFEKISRIIPVKNNFSIGKELTQTLKVKRKFVETKYHELISWVEKKTERKDKGHPSRSK